MSPDAEISPIVFPTLHRMGQERLEALGEARGHIAGFAAGMRAASDEIEARVARRDAEQRELIRAGQERIDAAVAVLAAAAAALTERTVPVLTDLQDVIAATAMELAEAIIGRELSDGDRSARSALKRALDRVDPAAVNVVKMNPGDLALLDENTRRAAGVRFVADPSLARGDAITELADGYLDARIGTALSRAKAALLGAGFQPGEAR